MAAAQWQVMNSHTDLGAGLVKERDCSGPGLLSALDRVKQMLPNFSVYMGRKLLLGCHTCHRPQS